MVRISEDLAKQPRSRAHLHWCLCESLRDRSTVHDSYAVDVEEVFFVTFSPSLSLFPSPVIVQCEKRHARVSDLSALV